MKKVVIYDKEVNADKGFDLCSFDGKVKEHFDTYEEADNARKKKGGFVRYWLAK